MTGAGRQCVLGRGPVFKRRMKETCVCLAWLVLTCSVVGGRDEGQEKGTICKVQRQAHDRTRGAGGVKTRIVCSVMQRRDGEIALACLLFLVRSWRIPWYLCSVCPRLTPTCPLIPIASLLNLHAKKKHSFALSLKWQCECNCTPIHTHNCFLTFLRLGRFHPRPPFEIRHSLWPQSPVARRFDCLFQRRACSALVKGLHHRSCPFGSSQPCRVESGACVLLA